ncbi:hypothetical protein [Microcoleus sp. N3A4]|uniref:hypothetical protein n=1 Tax=Microcoleus sp. N3A4 TaxID=3055379 RepID=UPI002FD716C6
MPVPQRVNLIDCGTGILPVLDNNDATSQIDRTIIISFTKINLGALCLWRTLPRSHRQIFHHQKGLTVFLQPTPRLFTCRAFDQTATLPGNIRERIADTE